MFRNPVVDAVVVLVAVLLIFGPKRLPLLGRSLGSGMREFKDGISGESTYSENDERPALPAPATSAPVATATAAAATSSEPAELAARETRS
jgi:sec-independent protein translocase protein TatA